MWKLLAEKGKIATLIGFVLSIPVNTKFIYLFFKGAVFSNDNLKAIIVINIVAMIWFILPSKIVFKSDKLIIEIED